jgi:hypothetical protein
MKKRIIILVGIFLMISSFGMAQHFGNPEVNHDKYYSQKIAFITDAVNLSPDEATAFWPLFNEQESKKKDLMKSMGKYRKDIASRFDELSEEEAKEALEFFQNHMKEMNALTLEYQNKYMEVISAKKVLLLLKAEKDFRRQMLKKIGERKRKKFN